MKKLVPVLLAVSLLVSMFAFPVSADSSVSEFGDFGSLLIVLWDSIAVDGSNVGSDPVTYLEDFGAVGGPASKLSIRGWAANASLEIKAFGYMIDDGEPVLNPEFMVNTDNAVIDAARGAGCEYVSRYQVDVDVSAIEGNHTIDFLIQFEDDTIYKMTTNTGIPVSFDYSADGSAVNATPEPTATPDPESLDNAPGPILRFNNEDDYAGFFGGQKNTIEDVYYDSEKNCYIISMGAVGDPFMVLMFSTLDIDGDVFELDTEKYKILQIGVRIDPAAGDRGQFYFQTGENPGYDEAKDVIFNYHDTTDLQYVNVNLGANKKWTGMMADSRLDPYGGCKVPNDFELYYMAFFTNEKAANEFGDKWLADGEITIPTAAPTPTKAPTAEPTATPEATPTEVPTEAPKATDEPKSDVTDKPAENTTPADQNKDNTDKKGPNAGLIIGIVVGVAALAAIIAGVAISAKKKKK